MLLQITKVYIIKTINIQSNIFSIYCDIIKQIKKKENVVIEQPPNNHFLNKHFVYSQKSIFLISLNICY